jgi:hypothetical protein
VSGIRLAFFTHYLILYTVNMINKHADSEAQGQRSIFASPT